MFDGCGFMDFGVVGLFLAAGLAALRILADKIDELVKVKQLQVEILRKEQDKENV